MAAGPVPSAAMADSVSITSTKDATAPLARWPSIAIWSTRRAASMKAMSSVAATRFLDQALDLTRHEPCLVVLVVRAVADGQLAMFGLRPQRLRLALDVVLDQGVGQLEDVLCGTVVLLHDEHRRVRIVVLE